MNGGGVGAPPTTRQNFPRKFALPWAAEVRQAPAVLCRLTDAWVILIAASLLGSYFVGMAIR